VWQTRRKTRGGRTLHRRRRFDYATCVELIQIEDGGFKKGPSPCGGEAVYNGTQSAVRAIFLSVFVFTGCASEEEIAWEKASTSQSLQGYEELLARFPNSEYTDAARDELNTLRDRASWEDAQAQDAIPALEAHLATFPESSFRDTARRRIKELTYPLANEGYQFLRVSSESAPYGCGDAGTSTGVQYTAEEETHITNAELSRLFSWDRTEGLYRVRNDQTMAGLRIDDQGRSVIFGSMCLGNLQLNGPAALANGVILFKNGKLIRPPE